LNIVGDTFFKVIENLNYEDIINLKNTGNSKIIQWINKNNSTIFRYLLKRDYPKTILDDIIDFESKYVDKLRGIVTSYYLWHDNKVYFGMNQSVDSATHFNIEGLPLPKETKVWLLYPEEQNNVLHDGYMTLGVVYRNLEDFKIDVENQNHVISKFINDHRYDSNTILMESYEKLINGISVEVCSNLWSLHRITLP